MGILGLTAGILAPEPAHAQATQPREARALTGRALRSAAIAAGYVSPEAALADDGRVIASATEGAIPERSLSVFDVVHLDAVFDGRPTAVGDTLLVYRRGRYLESPATHRGLGRVVYPTGMAVVRSIEGDVASAQLVDAFDAVLVGQSVQYLKPARSPVPADERIPGEGLVVGFKDRSAIQPPFAVLYLDLAPGSDLRPGQELKLVRPDAVDGRTLPEIELGSARVLDVGEAAATAAVTALARSDLRVGDRYRAVERAP
jgi:hypothetical protein